MSVQIERAPISLKSYAGKIYKAELRDAVGAVSREVLVNRIFDFIEDKKNYNKPYKDVWPEYVHKNHLPESFVIAFLEYIYNGVALKIHITS